MDLLLEFYGLDLGRMPEPYRSVRVGLANVFSKEKRLYKVKVWLAST